MEPEVLKMLTKNSCSTLLLQLHLLTLTARKLHNTKLSRISIQNSACFDYWIKLTTLKLIPTKEDTRAQKSSQIYILAQHKCVFKMFLYL